MSDTLSMADLDQELEKLADPLVKKRELLQTERDGLMAKREEIDRQLNKVNKLLRPIRPDLFEHSSEGARDVEESERPRPKRSRVVRPNATGFGISKEKLDEARKWVGEWLAEHDHVTQTEAMLQLSWDQSKTSAAFRALRGEGFIRQSGQKGSVKFYKLTPEAQEASTHGAS